MDSQCDSTYTYRVLCRRQSIFEVPGNPSQLILHERPTPVARVGGLHTHSLCPPVSPGCLTLGNVQSRGDSLRRVEDGGSRVVTTQCPRIERVDRTGLSSHVPCPLPVSTFPGNKGLTDGVTGAPS